jgi:hypothetical protein
LLIAQQKSRRPEGRRLFLSGDCLALFGAWQVDHQARG